MEDKQAGAELKAALGELRQLASQLVNNSREWFENRRHEMNHGNKQYGPRDPRRGEREQRGYGEGYGTASAQGRPREQDWEDSARNAGDDERWARGRESDADVRSQYGSGQRSGAREGGRFGEDRESGYYSRPGRAQGGEYSQGYGRERDEGRAYGPEDFSQRYATQGDVFDDQGYGDPGAFANQGGPRPGGDWRHRGGPSVSGDWRGGQARGGHAQGRGYAQDDARGYYGQQNDQRARGAGDYSGYSENDRNQQSFRGRGPRGYTRSDERITEDLNERLTDDWQLDADDIQVAVSGGVATLSGSVQQRWQKHHAENLAEGCSGVKDVRNDIRVVGTGSREYASNYGQQASGDNEAANRTRSSASAGTSASGVTGASDAMGGASRSSSGNTTPGSNTH